MAQSNWEADKMLDVYIYDYLIKRSFHASAKAFMTEGKVSTDPVAIDAPGGFLFEWWSVFWDIFIHIYEKRSEMGASYTEMQQMKARELCKQELQEQRQHDQQQRHLQQQHLLTLDQRLAQLKRDARHTSLNSATNHINSESLIGQPAANVMATKTYEECLRHPHQRDGLDESTLKQRVGESAVPLQDANSAILHKGASNPGQPSGQLLQSSMGNITTALQQGHVHSQHMCGNAQVDPSQFGVVGAAHLKSSLLNPGADCLPLKGWPLIGNEQLPSSLVQGGQKSFLQSPQQFQLFSAQQRQQMLLQAQAQGSLSSSSSSILGEMDPGRFRALLRNGLIGKDFQPTRTDGSQFVGSPIHAASPMVRESSQNQTDAVMKMKLAQLMEQQRPLLLQQQQQQQQACTSHNQQQDRMAGGVFVAPESILNNSCQALDQGGRKRKHPSSSRPSNSSGTGDIPGLSTNSAHSTQSAHTPGGAIPMADTSQHNGTVSKNLMVYGSDGTCGLASPSNELVDIEHFGEDCSLEDNVESFLSHDDEDQRDGLLETVKCSSTENSMDISKGFSFSEVGCLRANTGKVVCCHFSSDGKLLASAGHDKKAVLWNMDNLKLKSTLEEHSFLITDVRFSPNSTHLASSSFDKTVRVWDVDNPSYSLRTLTGHSTSVQSLDFHPNNGNLLCSCDSDSGIRYWSVSGGACTRVSKGGIAQIRFQPRVGQLLAAAEENAVVIFDVETHTCFHTLRKHNKPVHCLCWDATGDLVASVSEDCVRVSSVAAGGICIKELCCNGNTFQSCVFHPNYPSLMVIGCYQSLELWNMAENKTMTLRAHDGLISALAQSATNGMVASASYDKCVKLWK